MLGGELLLDLRVCVVDDGQKHVLFNKQSPGWLGKSHACDLFQQTFVFKIGELTSNTKKTKNT